MSSEQPEFFIEKLRRDHDLSSFDCGKPALTNWLQKFAWANQQADFAKTYMACRANRVVGYYALTAGSVHKHESPQRIAKGLANHPVGVVLLARLAVDRGCGRLDWAVLDWNETAIRFYRGIGATALDEWTTFRLTGDALIKLGKS